MEAALATCNPGIALCIKMHANVNHDFKKQVVYFFSFQLG